MTQETEPAPLTFKLLVGAAALYLGVRLIQGVAWLVDLLR
jgi:hypothetical protein